MCHCGACDIAVVFVGFVVVFVFRCCFCLGFRKVVGVVCLHL